MSIIPTENPKHGGTGLETIFPIPTTPKELSTTPFYRWFILNAIHKRDFKNGQFANQIPWIPGGAGAWKLESILSLMATSPLLPDAEKEDVKYFLREYQHCLSLGDGIMTDELCLAWDTLKRMFDLNDPSHIAGQSARRAKENDESKQKADLLQRKQDIKEEQGRRDAARLARDKMLEVPILIEGKEPETPRGKKRAVSNTADRSTSPTKKNKAFQIQVSDVSSDSSSGSESSDGYLYRFKELGLDIGNVEELDLDFGTVEEL
ncbi:hypothetical protein ACMFMG_004834 [Clarireedia jacksonii]